VRPIERRSRRSAAPGYRPWRLPGRNQPR
jgi:hypothetical protein